MPIQGIQFTIASNTEQHRSFQSTGSFVAYNPNDGVCFVSLDRTASSLQFDHRLPSQSGGRFPGPINSYLSLFYQDQSGSNTSGQVIVYPTPDQIELPHFWSIGRAIQASGTTVDISQGTQPQNPPASTTRLWVDGNGDLHLLSPTGQDNLVYDSSNIGTVALGGDLYGTIANGHIGLQNNSPANAHYSDNSLHRFAGLLPDNNAYFFIRDSASYWLFYNDAAGTEFSIDGNGNVVANGTISAPNGSIAAGTSLQLGAGSFIRYANAAPSRDDLVNFGGNGSLANAQASRFIVRRNYDNVAMLVVDGSGNLNISGAFNNGTNSTTTGNISAGAGTFSGAISSPGPINVTNEWFRTASIYGVYNNTQARGIYWPNTGVACDYPSGAPFATYPFSFQQFNCSANAGITANTWTVYPGLVQNVAAGTYFFVATGSFETGAPGAAHFEVAFFQNGSYLAGGTFTVPAANYLGTITVAGIVGSGSAFQLALEVLTSQTGCTAVATGLFSGGPASRFSLLKIG